MQRITSDRSWPLFDVTATRAIEHAAAGALPPHTLMQRAGLVVARLALAKAPHARTVWIACGPGNNGGDGFECAIHLKACGKQVVVSWAGDASRMPRDAAESMRRFHECGAAVSDTPPDHWDLGIDAMLGIGTTRALDGPIAEWMLRLNASSSPTLSIDVPSGLDSETGQGESVNADCTLSLLTLKPGLFTGRGRDACGEVWFDALEVEVGTATPSAELLRAPCSLMRAHASHKGTYGDVAVIGGAPGMSGAALLAGTAALHGGAGRVFVCLLEPGMRLDPQEPGLMFRAPEEVAVERIAVACGCGGGDVIGGLLHRIISSAAALVLDADALNAIAADAQLQAILRMRGERGAPTVLTPHPLEAARLSGVATPEIQSHRLRAAQALAERFQCVTVLKGSGTIVAAPGKLPAINPTGNARLATAGTGDVLAGMIAARLAGGDAAFDAACAAVFLHGLAADRFPMDRTLTASHLARLATY